MILTHPKRIPPPRHEPDCRCRSCRHSRHSSLVDLVWEAANRADDVVAWKMQPGGQIGVHGPIRCGPVGIADIVCVLAPAGKIVALEVKTGVGRQTEQQQSWANAVISKGGIYAIVRSLGDALTTLDIARESYLKRGNKWERSTKKTSTK